MMKRRLAAVAAWVFVLLAIPGIASAQKLVFVVRHAERADAGMTQAQTDPLLSAAGEARAAKLASMLADAGIKGIYVTEFLRTQNTGKPLSTKLGVAETQMKSTDTPALIAALRHDHPNDVVLIVGHSNTLPAIIKALGGGDVTIADNEYDNLFVIVPGTGTMTRIRFQ